MKRTLSLVALAAVASMAAPVKFGAGAQLGYDIASVGSDLEGVDAKAANFGIAVGPTAAYQVNEKFSIGAGINFQYDMIGLEEKDVDEETGESVTSDADMSLMTLGFQIAPTYQINEKISVKVGYQWDMPLAGTAKSGDQDMDIVWAPSKQSDLASKTVDLGDYSYSVPSELAVVSVHNIVLGGSYALNEKLAVTLQGKFALNGLSAEYKDNGDLKGAYESSKNITAHQIAVGVSYAFN